MYHRSSVDADMGAARLARAARENLQVRTRSSGGIDSRVPSLVNIV